MPLFSKNLNNCRQFRLLTRTLFIGQLVHPVGVKEMGKGDILASYKFRFIRVHDNLV